VVLLVTVGTDGAVRSVSVAQSAGQPLDAAAIAAVVRWRFEPARRDGQPFEARVRIPFRFATEVSAPGAPATAGPSNPPAPAAPLATPSPSALASPAPTATTLAALTEPATTTIGPSEQIEEVNVRGRQRKIEYGASDFVIDIGQLAVLPARSAEDLLLLAPGIFIANEGGEGHADEVFLRGFDAPAGSTIEFTVNGVPINDVDNPDAHGYANTHFIIPELVKSLQVTEGPFDPHQGDFAVAGSARYELGVGEHDRGLRLSYTVGQFDTQRYLALWAPQGEREGTFAAAQFSTSDGFGTNRANQSASAIGEYEGELGQRGLYRVLAMAYSTHYSSAGVVRLDDVQSGRIGFYGTYDPSQGGDDSRYTLSFDLSSPLWDGVATQQVFLTYRSLRIVENFTGFLLDVQEPGQSPHDQRGDAVEKDYSAITVGARGSYRERFRVLGQEQSVEAGYYARYDQTAPMIQRLRYGTQIPYLIDMDLQTAVTNLAGYLDVELRPLSFLTLRGGLRQESFSYNVLDLCATNGYWTAGEPLDVNCPSYDIGGYRSPTQRTTASGQILEPKGTVLVALPLGLSLTASAGVGAQSLDPTSIEQNENAPFVKLTAYEGGLLAKGRAAGFDWNARAIGFQTKVPQDLIFNPDLGRNAPSSASTRTGIVLAGRATSRFLDEVASFTAVHPTFDSDGTLVPYVPLVLARSDTALHGPIPLLRPWGRPLDGELGLAIAYIGKRPLPQGQFSDDTLEIDAAGSVRLGPLKLGVSVTNLTNRQFASSEFFYVSDFHTRAYPTLAPEVTFTAAPPRIILFTATLLLDRGGD
jgi:TonB family protein